MGAGHIEKLIDEFAALSEPGTGVTRLGYSALEREAHAVFARELSALGLTVWTDTAGNTVAELPGRVEGAPAIGTGSHLDSVPQAGRFDGIAGVCAAIEAARAVVSSGWRPRATWRFVAFAAEEGARFGQACNGSRAAAGIVSPPQLDALADAHGVTMTEAMRAVGLEPGRIAESRWNSEEWLAFIELHIEQGTVLEASDTVIGVVDAISGSTRLLVRLDGVASHTGGTPMHQRQDALVAAAECVLLCERVATDATHHGTRVTVGRLDVHPGSITTIPGRVAFTIDVRDFDSARQRRTAHLLDDRFRQICAERGVGIDTTIIGDTSPVILPVDLVDTIVRAARDLDLPYRLLSSGASHDSQQISRITRTGMIFVPSVGGLSHVPEETTSFADIARGTDVLVRAMAAVDAEWGALA
ncbi:Zn-dependent hydrolase [Jiangella asiatica]|uniref:Zn-dependent hydrolase n=1 Tax=Jiangella asiatica TaxID=2530372 RepID=A0A4R5DK55_9ACTN|nr:Zn-dependent hydrolase [Jiangella asiatica]